jgi:hypothetical protein
MKPARSNHQHWADEIELVVTDDGDGGQVPDSVSPAGEDHGPDRPRRPIGLRWCLAAVTLATVGVLAGGQLYAHRTRTIVRTEVTSTPGQATENLTGCPIGASCNFGELPDGGALLGTTLNYLPGVALVRAEWVFDSGSGQDYRQSLVVRTPSGILVTVMATRISSGPAAPAWQSPIPSVGPAEVALVVPGLRPGTALAVTATVPAGVAVPAADLQSLAADPSLQLSTP